MSCQYWPKEVKEHNIFGNYEIVLSSEESGCDYITRKLTVTKMVTLICCLATLLFTCAFSQDHKESITVTQYHYLQWPEGSKPKGTASILKMVADLVKTQSSTGNKGITVMCK